MLVTNFDHLLGGTPNPKAQYQPAIKETESVANEAPNKTREVTRVKTKGRFSLLWLLAEETRVNTMPLHQPAQKELGIWMLLGQYCFVMTNAVFA